MSKSNVIEIDSADAQNYAISTTTIKYEHEITKWLLKLEKCESGGKWIVVLDRNNEYSYGWLQFQQDTFNRYSKQLNLFIGKDLTVQIKDRASQFQLAKAMILDNSKNARNWLICSQKIGAVPK